MPAVGSYRYEEKVEGVPGTDVITDSWTAVPGHKDRLLMGERRATSALELKLSFEWTAKSVGIVGRETEANGEAVSCKFDQPLVDLQLPIAVGEKWHSASYCVASDRSKASFTRDSEVVGTTEFMIDRQAVTTYVVKYVEDDSNVTPSGDAYRLAITSTRYIRASDVLVVAEDRSERAPSASVASHKSLVGAERT